MGKRIAKTKSMLETDYRLFEIDGNIYQRQTRGDKLIEPFLHTTRHKYGKDLTYEYVQLYNYRTKRSHLLSYQQLLYAWFIGDIPADCDVDHIDNNTLNNNLDNLRLLTQEDNLRKKPVSRNQYNYWKTDEEILADRVKKKYIYDRETHKYRKAEWWEREQKQKKFEKILDNYIDMREKENNDLYEKLMGD